MPYRELVKKLDRVQLLHRIHVHRAAADTGVYLGQLPMLEYVMEHDRCTQRQAADFLHISPPSVATSVKRMQRTGLLTKAEDENDLRFSRLSVTEEGRRMARRCRERFDEVDRTMFAGFSEQECSALEALLDRLAENLSTDELRGENMMSLLERAKGPGCAHDFGQEGHPRRQCE